MKPPKPPPVTQATRTRSIRLAPTCLLAHRPADRQQSRVAGGSVSEHRFDRGGEAALHLRRRLHVTNRCTGARIDGRNEEDDTSRIRRLCASLTRLSPQWELMRGDCARTCFATAAGRNVHFRRAPLMVYTSRPESQNFRFTYNRELLNAREISNFVSTSSSAQRRWIAVRGVSAMGVPPSGDGLSTAVAKRGLAVGF